MKQNLYLNSKINLFKLLCLLCAVSLSPFDYTVAGNLVEHHERFSHTGDQPFTVRASFSPFNSTTNSPSGYQQFSIKAVDQTKAIAGGVTNGYGFTKIVAISDTVVQPSTNLTFSNVTRLPEDFNSFDVSWTNGSGDARVVFMVSTRFNSELPMLQDNMQYSVGGTDNSGLWKCVYKGTGSGFKAEGVALGTYKVVVIDYVNTASPVYVKSGLAPANVTTVGVVAPSQASYRLAFTNTTATSTTLSWTNGTGAARAVFVKQTNNGYAQAVNNTTYSANSSFGAGTQIGTTGWYCVYVGTGNSTTISGLNATTLYRFTVVDYNGSAGSQQYIATGLAPAMVFTGSNGGGGSFRTNGIATASNLGDSTSPAIEAANILSPNGDGKNDTWIVKNIEAYPNSTVAVYTKDGRQIFQEKGYYNEWNGGGSLTKGTYYYTIDLGNGEVQKGYITVL